MHIVTPLSALQGDGFTGAKLILTQGNLRRELLLDATGELIAGEIDNLPVGDWVVNLDIYDTEGDVTHTASGVVRVRKGETATLRLEAQPNDGVLEIVAHIHEFAQAPSVQRTRIIFHNNQSTTLSQDNDDPMVFRGLKELRPGDYEYRIELYGASQAAADRLYQSPWESVRIYPGKTVRATWHAAAGSARIEMGMTRMPAPPGPLTVDASEQGYRLTWEASPDEEVATYRVYLKQDEFGTYSLKHETSASGQSWVVPEKESQDGAWAAVTAVTADGRESYRSNVVYLSGRDD